MKKVFAVILTLCMLAVLPAMAMAEVDIGYSVPDTTNPFIGWLTSTVQEMAKAEGLTVQVADAGGNATTQMTQVENFIAMNVKVIAVMPADPLNMPRFLSAIPSVFVSFANPYHMQDVPAIPTFFNAYAASAETVEAFVAALFGEFQPTGKSPVSVTYDPMQNVF